VINKEQRLFGNHHLGHLLVGDYANGGLAISRDFIGYPLLDRWDSSILG
jgi:hypothetical protein